MQAVHSIPGKVTMAWEPSVRAMVDTWQNYFITLDQFKDAVMVKGLDFAKAHQAQAWIVDSSAAKGAFPPEIQQYIGTDVFAAFVKNGVRWFITITSESALTNLTIRSYTSQAGPSGIQLVEAKSAAEAVEWLRKHAT